MSVRIGPLIKGNLHGYKLHMTTAERQAKLVADIKRDGWTKVFHRVNALSVMFRNQPSLRRIVNADKAFLRKIHQHHLKGGRIMLI